MEARTRITVEEAAAMIGCDIDLLRQRVKCGRWKIGFYDAATKRRGTFYIYKELVERLMKGEA